MFGYAQFGMRKGNSFALDGWYVSSYGIAKNDR